MTSPTPPAEAQHSADAAAYASDAVAALQSESRQAFDDAFRAAADHLAEALVGLVRAEVSRALADDRYAAAVSSPAVSEAPPAAPPGMEDAGEEWSSEDDGAAIDADRPPLSLAELDDPFLDALIRKEPLSA